MPRKKFATATLTTANTEVTTPSLEPGPSIPATFTDGLPLPRLLVFDLDYTLWPFWVDTHVRPPLKPTVTAKDSSKPNTAMTDATGETFTFYREVPGILYAARQKGIIMGLASRTHTPDLAGILLKNIVVPVPSSSGRRSNPKQNASKGKLEDGEELETKIENQPPTRAWDFFKYREIYPGSKTTHFQRIHTASKKKESASPPLSLTTNIDETNRNTSEDDQGHGQAKGQIAYNDMIFFDDESRNRDVERKYGVTFVLVRDGVTTDEIDRGVRAWRKRRSSSSATPAADSFSSSPELELDDEY